VDLTGGPLGPLPHATHASFTQAHFQALPTMCFLLSHNSFHISVSSKADNLKVWLGSLPRLGRSPQQCLSDYPPHSLFLITPLSHAMRRPCLWDQTGSPRSSWIAFTPGHLMLPARYVTSFKLNPLRI